MTDEMDFNKFFHSVASKLGAGTLEIVLVVAITANYFGYITINPWLYDIKNSSIMLNLGELQQEINVDKDVLESMKKRKPFIRIIEEGGHFILEIPKI